MTKRPLLFLWLVAPVLAAVPVIRLNVGSGVYIDLIRIAPGTFMQGSPVAEVGRGSDELQRRVTITKPFYIGRFPVTYEQWEQFAADRSFRTEAEDGKSGGFGWDGEKLTQRKDFTWKSPGFAQGPKHPVTMVTWGDAKAFATWLGRRNYIDVALPTEAQWEYACRAGTKTPWPTGSDAAAADAWAWHRGLAGNATHPTGLKKANAWGLQDMGGQVWEWCEDWYGPYPPGTATDPLQTNDKLSDKPRRVLRGGSFLKDANSSRSAARYRNDARSRNADNGFRVVIKDSPGLLGRTVDFSDLPPDELTAPVIPAEIPLPGAPIFPPAVPAETPDPVSPPPATPPPVVQSKVVPVPPAAPPVPPVPAEPAEPRQAEQVHGAAAAADSGGNGNWKWLLAVPGVWIVWKLLRRKGSAGAAPAPEPVTQVRPGPPTVRMAKDGFFISTTAAEGTLLRWRFRTDGGQHEGQGAFSPGAEGMFVFTGSAPLEAYAWVDTDGGDNPPVPLPPVAVSTESYRTGVGAGMLSQQFSQNREPDEEEPVNPREQRKSRPSSGFPSAY